MKDRIISIARIVIGLISCCIVTDLYADSVTIIDARHYSHVLGEERNYRIFLPASYYKHSAKKYPVIYFMHGWGQRSFGDGPSDYAGFDQGDQNKGDNIEKFVSKHEVIVVKSDGYNRNPNEPYYPRPYNISPVETYRQFPIYFPELISYIDKNYRTIADREHRGISGLSMGGFMTFMISAKYPHLFSAAGSFCGSPEFIVGPKDFPVEYRHIDMYRNYSGVNVRLHYGDKDFIRAYHQDMDRVWPSVMEKYESRVYDAEHSTCGLGDMFGFLVNTFNHPPKKPVKWSHTEVYPKFDVWGYEVETDRDVPGFTVLENVDKKGFSCVVKKFVPDGELFPRVNVSVTTPALYEKNKLYIINDIDTRTNKVSQKKIQSDSMGRLKIGINGSMHHVGINKAGDKPNIAIAAIEIVNMPWAIHNKDVKISIKLLNKGMSAGNKIQAVLSATSNGADIIKNSSSYGNISINQVGGAEPFTFRISGDSVELQKFRLTIKDDKNNEWVEYFEIPMRKDVADIKEFVVADGKTFTVAKSGEGKDTLLLGHGNGDGIANPGESIVILVKDQGKFYRSQLAVADKYVNPFGIHARQSDYWGNYDYVGGSAKYSIPLIASACPEEHVIEAFAEYWLPDKPFHIIKQGVVKIKVKGKDNTGPEIKDAYLPVENVFQVRIDDGSAVKQVKAKFTLKKDPSVSFETDLADNGGEGDAVESDNVFSKKIIGRKFGFYKVNIEATDSFGNRSEKEIPGELIIH